MGPNRLATVLSWPAIEVRSEAGESVGGCRWKFSILSSENQTRVPITVAIVLATLLLALALCAMAVFQVLDEYRMLGEWLARPEPVSTGELRALRQDIGARIIVRSIASAVLLLCTLATLWLQQRQLTVRRALHQVKWLAHNILSSVRYRPL